MNGRTVIEARELTVSFPVRTSIGIGGPQSLLAVDGVSLQLRDGEVLAVVGESGCGKTTLVRSLAGLQPISAGSALFEGVPFEQMTRQDRRRYRRNVQMVFQDPYDSLNPRNSVVSTLSQPLRIHEVVPAKRLRSEAARLLESVGLTPADGFLDRYPHQLSGGQRQRVVIARSLAPGPTVLLADEPVSSLDVTVQAQILRLLIDLRSRLGLAVVFVTHDLNVARSISDQVMVMYMGQVVERGPTHAVFKSPRHPYTAALLSASPVADPKRARERKRIRLSGDVPSNLNLPLGCRFHDRCPVAETMCATTAPPVVQLDQQESRCHFAGEILHRLKEFQLL